MPTTDEEQNMKGRQFNALYVFLQQFWNTRAETTIKQHDTFVNKDLCGNPAVDSETLKPI